MVGLGLGRFVGGRYGRLVDWCWRFIWRSHSRLFRLHLVGLVDLVAEVRSRQHLDLRRGGGLVVVDRRGRRGRRGVMVVHRRLVMLHWSVVVVDGGVGSPGPLAGTSEEVDEGTGEVTDEAAQ